MSDDLQRYHRQMLLPGFAEAGQRRLRESTALVLGCGALGGVAADALARAGVGRLVVVDRDVVELTNLQRQVLFDERDVDEALPKAEAARRRLARINAQVEVVPVVDDVTHRNFARFADGADVIVDGLDNFETRYLANDFAVRHGVPYVYGGAVGTVGMAAAILPRSVDGANTWERLPGGSGATACLRCLFDEVPAPGTGPTCDTAGVLGPLIGVVAGFQAAEALKILSGNLDRVCRGLLYVDLWSGAVQRFAIAAAAGGGCRCCDQRDFEFLDGRRGAGATVLCGRNAVQIRSRQSAGRPDLDRVAARLSAFGRVDVNAFMLRAGIADGDGLWELTLFADGRAIVKGTGDAAVARGVYARYVGS